METRKKKSFKRLFAFLMAFVMVASLAVSAVFAAEPTFKDVPKDYEFYDEIEDLAAKDIVSGFGDTGLFKPEENLTRAQAAKMVALGADKVVSKAFKTKFTDVPATLDLHEHIWALEEEEVVKGFKGTTLFKPAADITRGHVAKIVALAFDLEMGPKEVTFSDLPENDKEVAEAIEVLASYEIVKGYGTSGEFRPELPVTRGQFAKMVSRAMAVAFDEPIAKKLDISNKQLAKNIYVKLVYLLEDQFGREMETELDEFSLNVYNTTDPTRVVGVYEDDDFILVTEDAQVGDIVRITLMHIESGLIKTVELPVVATPNIVSLEFGDIVDPTENPRLTGGTEDVILHYTAKNQYGEKVVLDPYNVSELALFFTPADKLAEGFSYGKDDDGVDVLFFSLAGVTKNTEVKITGLLVATGGTAVKSFTVYPKPAVYKAKLSTVPGVTYAADDSEAPFKLEAWDQFGVARTPEEITEDLARGEIAFTSSASDLMVDTSSYDEDKGTILASLGSAVGTAKIFTFVGAEVNELTVNVKAARVPTKLIVAEAPEATVAENDTTGTLAEFEVLDQYGDEIDLDTNHRIYAKLTTTSKLEASPLVLNESDDLEMAIKAKGEGLGKDKVVFELQRFSDELDENDQPIWKKIDSRSYEIEVVAAVKSFVVETDKAKYTAGEDIKVTIKAMKKKTAATVDFHDKYNGTVVVSILVGDVKYLRTVTFVNGVGSATVTAKKAMAEKQYVKAGATINDPVETPIAAQPEIQIVTGAASAFKIDASAKNLTITTLDAHGNVVKTFTGEKLVKLTYPVGMTDLLPEGIDVDGNLLVQFTEGTADIEFVDDLVSGTYTVTFGEVTGSHKVTE